MALYPCSGGASGGTILGMGFSTYLSSLGAYTYLVSANAGFSFINNGATILINTSGTYAHVQTPGGNVVIVDRPSGDRFNVGSGTVIMARIK